MIVFADTSGLATFFVDSQPGHLEAVEKVKTVCRVGGRLVTTNYVLAELTALFTRPLRVGKTHQIEYLRLIRTSDWIDNIGSDPVLEDAAWVYWEKHLDKEWSFVDCFSFTVMKSRGLNEAFTTDHHFEQAGFVRLLK